MKYLYCKHQQQILPWSTGGAYAYIMHDCGPYKLIIGAHCEFVAIQTQQIALLDTAAELSVAGVEVYQSFTDEQTSLGLPVGTKTIHTRLGNFEGHLYLYKSSYSNIPIKLYDLLWSAIRIIAPCVA